MYYSWGIGFYLFENLAAFEITMKNNEMLNTPKIMTKIN